MSAKRSDGLDNPLSPNSGGANWMAAERMCEESAAVESYSRDGGVMTIAWVDGTESKCRDPQAAMIEIAAMEAN